MPDMERFAPAMFGRLIAGSTLQGAASVKSAMPFEEGVDRPVCRLLDFSVVPDFVDVLVGFDEFDGEQLVFVVGVAVTDERPGGNAARSSRRRVLVRPTRPLPTTAARSTAPWAMPLATAACAGEKRNRCITASSNSVRYAASLLSRWRVLATRSISRRAAVASAAAWADAIVAAGASRPS